MRTHEAKRRREIELRVRMFMGFEERLPSGGVLPYSQEMTAKSFIEHV